MRNLLAGLFNNSNDQEWPPKSDRLQASWFLSSPDEYFEQSTRPEISDPIRERILTGDYKMKFRKGCKKITVLRFLLSKFLYDRIDPLHLDEFLALSHLYFELMEVKDPNFKQKWISLFYRKHPFFEKLFESTDFPIRVEMSKEEVSYFREYLEDLALSPEAYFGMKGNRNIRDSFLLSLGFSSLKSVKPKPYIGVGYRDKGTCRNPAEDGSPTWQEIASVREQLERIELEMRLSQGSPLDSQYVEKSP